MSRSYIELSYFQVALAALLILINGAISVLLEARARAPAAPGRRLHGRAAPADRAGARVGLPGGPLVRRAGDDGDA